MPLIDLLVQAGAAFDPSETPDILSVPLGEGAFATAEALIRRGARMDVRRAAALGRVDLVQRLIHDGAGVTADAFLIPLPEEPEAAKAQQEAAFLWVCDEVLRRYGAKCAEQAD